MPPLLYLVGGLSVLAWVFYALLYLALCWGVWLWMFGESGLWVVAAVHCLILLEALINRIMRRLRR